MSRFSAIASHRAGKNDAEFKRDYYFHVGEADGSDPDVAVESCEFWAAFVEADLEPESVNILREFTPHLIPVLLTNMAYEEDDEEVLQAEEDELNADRPDRDQDIKPTFRAQKDKSFGEGGKDSEELRRRHADWGTWNLRKSSASGLDTLSLHLATSFCKSCCQWLSNVWRIRTGESENLRFWRWVQSRKGARTVSRSTCLSSLVSCTRCWTTETFGEIDDVLDIVSIFSVVVSIRHAC